MWRHTFFLCGKVGSFSFTRLFFPSKVYSYDMPFPWWKIPPVPLATRLKQPLSSCFIFTRRSIIARTREWFSDVAKVYLQRYCEIRDEMMTGMMDAELTDSLSHYFIVRTIPHHRAVDGKSGQSSVFPFLPIFSSGHFDLRIGTIPKPFCRTKATPLCSA